MKHLHGGRNVTRKEKGEGGEKGEEKRAMEEEEEEEEGSVAIAGRERAAKE